ALGQKGPDVKAGFGDPAGIGYLLLEKFLLPFEASSILLRLDAVGGIVLAVRRGGLPGSKDVPERASGAGSPGTPRESGPGDPVPGAHPASSEEGVATAR